MQFLESFHPELVVESPGRINLIGEHTDYNEGFVLPAAIARKITFAFQKNGTERTCRFYSKSFDKGFVADLKTITRSTTEWENYLLGVLHELLKGGNSLRGFDCTIQSDLPLGAGLSSSAALECGLAYGLNVLFDLGLGKIDIVQLSQKAEHSYVGTKCGIMDQFASVMSRSGHVLLLDCRSLEWQQIPITLQPYKMVLLNTKVSHNLATSEYNLRRKECEEAVARIQAVFPSVRSLRDVTPEMLQQFKAILRPVVFKRCSFIVSENERVLKMVRALEDNDLKTAGRLLYDAHEGLRSLYEVSCTESDFLVTFAKARPEVLGARQVGGGFGGCVLNLVHGNEIKAFAQAASQGYRHAFQTELEVLEVTPNTGTEAYKV